MRAVDSPVARTEDGRGVVDHLELQVESRGTLQRECDFGSCRGTIAFAVDLVGDDVTGLIGIISPLLEPWLRFAGTAGQQEE